ncbi:CLIP domain-containing serine protease 2-like isoform X2 [Penaeus japonicus]|uniref:CLIP domain-containing serine protease 2-like isoform X2 n=1 Tax=Penaeus japonicus TaxID=27405 RepID=UPI001C70BCC7|nr:CLIP domain-containing serine protease 2-like isoform X2 [Penaeus japonicus]
MLWLVAIPLVICTADAQSDCGSRNDCPGYLSLIRQRSDPLLRPFFDTNLGKELVKFTTRCCRTSLIPSEEACGISEPSGPISDLQRRGAWPWFAALSTHPGNLFRARYGGTLITRRHVLSTAHTLFQVTNEPPPKYVRLGEYDLSTETEAPYVELAIAGFKEAGYNADRRRDIAVIILERDVVFNDFIRPACLPFNYRNEGFENQHLAVVGYGRTADGQSSNVPLAAVVPVVDLATCKRKYKDNFLISDSVICAGGSNDACKGDSGGPLNYFDVNTNRFYVVGIVAFGPASCGQSDIPGGYTRVGAFLDWINHTISSDAA